MLRRWFLAAVPCLAAVAAGAEQPVYDADGISATAFGDCDGTDYVLVSLSDAYAPGRYAARDRFADTLAPHLGAIFDAAAAWLEERCGNTETITVVGLVNAVPVHAVAAAGGRAWTPESAAANGRSLAFLAAALPEAGTEPCKEPDGEAAALRTSLFTAKVARTTGSWNRHETLAAIVPLHREIAALLARRGFDWSCGAAFALAELAVRADLARAEILRENIDDILALERDAALRAAFAGPGFAPIDDFRDIVVHTADGPAVRYGGYRLPIVARIEAAFGLGR